VREAGGLRRKRVGVPADRAARQVTVTNFRSADQGLLSSFMTGRTESWRRLVTASVFGAVAWNSMSVAQSEPSPQAGRPTPIVRTDIRPDPDGPPTTVSVGVRLLDLMQINDVDQTLTADFVVVLRWTDPRLAQLAGAEVPLDDVWSPGIVIINSGRTFTSRPREVGVGPGGEVTYVQRYHATLATHHNLRDFPFDDQVLVVSLASLEWPEDDVRLLVDDDTTGRRERLNISDWTIGPVTGAIGREYVDAFDDFHSRYDLKIVARRLSAYYIWKVLLPLVLIVAMSWFVFWIDPAKFGPQIGLSATSMLTLIAFIFATTNMVPELGYFTRLDVFIGGATILVFLAMLEAVATAHLVQMEKSLISGRLDRWCRVVYPLAFVILAYFAFFI
jgi:hypothetical protein